MSLNPEKSNYCEGLLVTILPKNCIEVKKISLIWIGWGANFNEVACRSFSWWAVLKIEWSYM